MVISCDQLAKVRKCLTCDYIFICYLAAKFLYTLVYRNILFVSYFNDFRNHLMSKSLCIIVSYQGLGN